MMNKVVSIALAKQVFWVNEQAYKQLDEYLKTIKEQLAPEAGAQEIVADIELRLAELLYGSQQDSTKSLDDADVTQAINQIGYFDEPETKAVKLPQRRTRNLDNHILAGVCSGIAERTIFPAFIMRLLFVALSFVFGLGVFLYLILWVSWPAATPDANPTQPSTALRLQKLLFLPVTLLAWLINAATSEQSNWLKKLFKVFGAMLMLAAMILIVGLLIEITQLAILSPLASILFGAAVIYLLIFAIWSVVRRYYSNGLPRRMDDRLKTGAILSLVMVIGGLIYLATH